MYDSFSYYYDKMMDIDYDIFLNIVKKYIKKNGMILDAGCGTGELLIKLFDEGYNVCGLDLSNEMLNIAKSKIDKLDYRISLYENDLSESFAVKEFSAIVSFLDVFNYIEDYKKAFKHIYEALTPGGIFLFDVHQIDYLNDLIGYSEEEELDGFSYKWKVLKGSESNSIIHDLTIYANNKEYHENHFQRTYDINTYLNALESVGFKTTLLPETDDYKVFIMAKK